MSILFPRLKAGGTYEIDSEIKYSNSVLLLQEKLPVLFGERCNYEGTCITKQEHLTD